MKYTLFILFILILLVLSLSKEDNITTFNFIHKESNIITLNKDKYHNLFKYNIKGNNKVIKKIDIIELASNNINKEDIIIKLYNKDKLILETNYNDFNYSELILLCNYNKEYKLLIYDNNINNNAYIKLKIKVYGIDSNNNYL